MIPNDSDSLRESAFQTLERLADLLNGEKTTERIDEPIDRAFHEYVIPSDFEFSHERFHEVTGDFIKFLHEKAPLPGGKLTLTQAHDEAIAFLDQSYQGTHKDGYHGAMLDASDPRQPGIVLVLQRLVELIKAWQRRKYIRWVVSRHIDPADWRLKCAIAELLITRNRDLLPPKIAESSPAQYADLLESLFILIQRIKNRP